MTAARSPRRFWLFAPFALAALLIAAYSAYWIWMADALTKGVEEWIEDQRRIGYRMEHTGLEMRGYPYRFSLHVESPEIEPPTGAWAWRTQTLRLSAMPYNLNHLIAQAPERHDVRGVDGRIYRATASDMAASLSWTSDALKRFSFVAPEAVVERDGAPYSKIDGLAIHVSPMPDAPDDIRIMIQAARIELPAPPDSASWLGDKLGPVRAPIAIENGFEALNARDPLKALITRDVQIVSPLTSLDWGPLRLRAKTTLHLDASARPEGLVEVRLEEIDALESALSEAGALTNERRIGLAALKGMTQGDSFAPIDLDNGKIKIGPIAVADLEPLY